MIVYSSDAVEAMAAAVQNFLNLAPSAWLGLYTNDLPLNPDAENPASYVEANYPGYVRFGTVGLWSAPIRANAGVYYVESGPWAFGINGGAVPAVLYGWYLIRGSRVVFMQRFDGSPVTINPGSPGPRLLVRLTQGSQTVVCPPR